MRALEYYSLLLIEINVENRRSVKNSIHIAREETRKHVFNTLY